MKYIAVALSLAALTVLTSCRPSPEKLLATADKYHANKKYKEAGILYQKVLAKDKKNADAYYKGGLNLLDEGNPVEASQYLRRAVDLKPNNTDAAAKLAEIYLTAYLSNPARFKNLLPEIQDLRKKIVQHDPNSFQADRIQGILDMSDQKMDDALAQFAKANSLHPHSRELIGWYAQALVAAGHPDQAETLVKDMLANDKTWTPGYDFLFVLYREQKNPGKEEQILREHAQNDPSSAAAITNLANFLAVTGRVDEAESVMKRVISDSKTFPNGKEMLGDFYVRVKKFDQAIQQYQEGAKADSKQEVAYQERIVLVYTMMGKRDDAMRLSKSIAEKNPKDATANEMYASLLLESGMRQDVAKSLADLTTLSKNNPTDPVLHLDLAKANFLTKDSDKALSEALEALQDEAKKSNPRSQVILPGRMIAARIYESRGQHAQALEQMNQVLSVQPGNPEARLIKDQALIGLNQADQSMGDLEALVKQYPKLNDARLSLGSIYLSQHQFDKANEQFSEVWNSQPPDPRGFLSLQQVKVMQGKSEDAVRAMNDLVAKNPTNLPYRYQLALFQMQAGQKAYGSNQAAGREYFEQAADNLKQILKTTANSVDVWLRLGMLQQFLGQNDAALASYEQASHADPRNTQALINRGGLLEVLNRKKEAADLYNQALGIDPNNPIALNNLAFLNAENGNNLDQAMSFAERAKKQAPKSPDVSDTLGYVYLRKNLNAQALEIFRQNVQDQPQNPTFHLHLAMALLKNGDKQGARDEAQKALKIAPPAQQTEIRNFVGQIG
jgi:tetratricopeptide (TPR) repeat protein